MSFHKSPRIFCTIFRKYSEIYLAYCDRERSVLSLRIYALKCIKVLDQTQFSHARQIRISQMTLVLNMWWECESESRGQSFNDWVYIPHLCSWENIPTADKRIMSHEKIRDSSVRSLTSRKLQDCSAKLYRSVIHRPIWRGT